MLLAAAWTVARWTQLGDGQQLLVAADGQQLGATTCCCLLPKLMVLLPAVLAAPLLLLEMRDSSLLPLLLDNSLLDRVVYGQQPAR